VLPSARPTLKASSTGFGQVFINLDHEPDHFLIHAGSASLNYAFADLNIMTCISSLTP
jgi:hypothetical protein